MATTVSASYAAGDLSPHRLVSRSGQPRQSILPLRREKTMFDGDLNRNQELNPLYSSQPPMRSSAFSAEKQYERRQSSTQTRSAKSEEVFRLIDRRLHTGVHGVRHLFRSNDPNQEGKLSKEAFRRVLMQLCGFINAEEWEKVCRLFHLTERDATITFEEFLSYFTTNEKAKRELALTQIDQRHSTLLALTQNVTSANSAMGRRRYLPKLSANYCFSLMKSRSHDPSFEPSDFLPGDCLNNGIIIREHLKKILENFQLTEILTNENEFEKLWLKFDLDRTGMVRSNVFLRLLDYRRNLADEINADIQRLVSRSTAAQLIDRRTSATTSSVNVKRTRQNKVNQSTEEIDQEVKQIAPPPSSLDEHLEPSKVKEPASTRELSTKFRHLVQQHRQMIQQLKSTDEFLPFLDRKINEGYFCLKTVFNYLDPTQTNFITKDQLVAALNQFDILIENNEIDGFLRKHHLHSSKDELLVDYQGFLKYFQDRSDSSFVARTLSTFSKAKSMSNHSDYKTIENGLIDLLHHLFLSLTAAFKQISTELNELCPENELFLILKKELGLPDNFQFSYQQKMEIYRLLNCSGQMKKKQLPYRRLLQILSKTPIAVPKEQFHEIREKLLTPPRNLSYIEKTLNDLVRLRMHTFTKAFARIDNPRTDSINKHQFYEVLKEMGTDLSRSEIDLVWTSSGLPVGKSIPFSTLIRQIILFNREENQWMISQLQRSRSTQEHFLPPTVRSSLSAASSRALSSSDDHRQNFSIDQHEVFSRILPMMRQNYHRIKYDLLEKDPTATGLVDFPSFLEILHRYSVSINELEFSSLIRADNPKNGSKVQYPFFLRKFHPDGPNLKSTPWARIHPVYEQILQKQHAKHPIKEIYDQRMQNPRDLKYFIRLFQSCDKPRKGFLTNDEFYALLCDSGITLNKSSEDYYQLFSKFDRRLQGQFNYIDLLRTMIHCIMS